MLRWLLFYSSVMVLLNSHNIEQLWLLHLETRSLKLFFFLPLDFQLNSHLSTLANIHKIYHTLNRLVMTCHFVLAEQLGLWSRIFHDWNHKVITLLEIITALYERLLGLNWWRDTVLIKGETLYSGDQSGVWALFEHWI